MRVKGVIFILVVALLGFGLSFISVEGWIEESIEEQASILNEAKVEIDGFTFDVFGLHVGWSRLQVTNPNNTMMNTFETGETEFDVEFWPLLWRKVIIEDVRLTGFALETERETDGYFEIPVSEETGEPEEPGFIAEVTSEVGNEISKNAQMEFSDVKDDINVDSLMAMVNLQSLDKMDSLKTGLEQNYQNWNNTITNNTVEEDVKNIRTTVEAIDINKLKDPKQAIAALNSLKKVTAQADSIRTFITTTKSTFQTDLANSKESLGSIDTWIQEDIDRAANVAKLPEINAQSIGTALFGGSLLGDFNSYLEYLGMARTYGSKLIGSDDEEEKIERYEGVNYEFTDKYDWPSFWVKNIELSGRTNTDIDLSGQVTDISSDQEKTGKPIIFDLGGEDENAVSLTVDGEINYLGEEPKEQVKVAYQGFSLQSTKISPSELLPYDLTQGTGRLSVDLSVIDKRIESEVEYLAENINFDFESAGSPKNTVESLIRSAISDTDQINATALINNTSGPLNVRVRSNIDDLFLNALKGTVTKEVEEAKRKIQNEVEGRVNDKKAEVETFAREKEAELRSEYDKYEARVNEQLKVVDEKKAELEKKKKELEDAIKNRAQDAIKKIGF
ncbi:MAG: TIGR03545 family protein [Balneolaceae bacterium]